MLLMFDTAVFAWQSFHSEVGCRDSFSKNGPGTGWWGPMLEQSIPEGAPHRTVLEQFLKNSSL